MAITAGMVKELREMTGAGMMDCKKALSETNGDMDAAVEFLRKNGQAKAEKKAGRIAAEGIVKTVVKDDKVAAIVEVNSETDFVAKNDEFQGFVEAVANQVVDSEAADLDAFMAEAWEADTTKTVKDALVEKIAVIGENLNIRRFEKVAADNGVVVPYIHGGGRIGVLVVADTDVVNDEIKVALKNVAMQVAAMSPKYVSREEVSQDYLDHEKEILLAQAKKENPEKPENIIEKMIIGRLNKELKEICLLDQVYVQDSDLTVGKYVDKVAKENGANVKVTKFVRFETGEGIEKKVDDFAAEVAAQAGMYASSTSTAYIKRNPRHKFTCDRGFLFICIVRRTYSEMKRSEIELSVLVRMSWCTYNAQAVPRPKPHKFTCDRGFLFICIVRRTYSEMKRSG